MFNRGVVKKAFTVNSPVSRPQNLDARQLVAWVMTGKLFNLALESYWTGLDLYERFEFCNASADMSNLVPGVERRVLLL
jgi:hypothetical protein